MVAVLNENTQFLDTNGKPLVDGRIYIGDVDQDPVANPKTIYSDRELQTVLANPQPIDANGRSANKIWLSGRYSIQVNDRNGVQVFQDLDRGQSETDIGSIALGNVIGTDQITAQASPTITSYVDKMVYVFTPAATNNGPVTLNIDGLGAKRVVKNNFSTLRAGNIVGNKNIEVIYNENLDEFTLVKDIPPTRGHISGLQIAPGPGGTSGVVITISPGEASSDEATGGALMQTATPLFSKRIQGVWQEGDDQNGLDQGAVVANTWYNVFMIMRTDTGQVDYLFSTSLLSPVMPANYDRKRRIGSFRTDGSSQIIGFTQVGDNFVWDVPVNEYAQTNFGVASIAHNVMIPPIAQSWVGSGVLFDTALSASAFCYFRPGFATDIVPTGSNSQLAIVGTSGSQSVATQLTIPTNTAVINTRADRTSATLGLTINTYGWIDRRGKD